MTISKAFGDFVQAPDDVEGLLAYALYKRTIHERRSAGHETMGSEHRDPQPTEIGLYRTQAASYLATFGESVITAERPNILNAGVEQSKDTILARLETLSVQLRSATGFWWPGVVVGVVAWIISIVLTILVVSVAPEWVLPAVRHITGR